MPERTSLRSHTPPKFAALLDEKNANLLLEKRLQHFITWLGSNGILPMRQLDSDAIASLIQEYVNG